MTPLAIAAATAALRRRLLDGLAGAAPALGAEAAVSVTATASGRAPAPGAAPRLALSLLQAQPLAGWQAARPGGPRPSAGIALELRYAITAVADAELAAELLLGHAVRALADSPVVDAATLRAWLAVAGAAGPLAAPGAMGPLAAPGALDGIGRLQLDLVAWPLEALPALWSATGLPGRPTLACTARVIPA